MGALEMPRFRLKKVLVYDQLNQSTVIAGNVYEMQCFYHFSDVFEGY